MRLNDFYKTLDDEIFFNRICDNSKDVTKNDIYVDIKKGQNINHSFINDAINNGAIFIITDIDIDYPHIKVSNPQDELIRLLEFYFPQVNNYTLIGVTGTDGKTTTSTLVFDILDKLYGALLMGTNGIKYKKNNIKSKNTTPSNITIYENLANARKLGINKAVLEVSSEGIADGRAITLEYDRIILTNLSHEHLNTHKNMHSYAKTKLGLFKRLKSGGVAILNADDEYFSFFKHHIKKDIITYGLEHGDYQAKQIIYTIDGIRFDLYYKGQYMLEIESSLVGKFNAYNILAAIACLSSLKINLIDIKRALNDRIEVAGRFNYFKLNRRHFIVDFAHTPRAIEKMLETVRELHFNKIFVILGAQGKKDSSKRKKMGMVASNLSDVLILTSEDPKDESILKIFSELSEGIKKDYYLLPFRKDAVNLAINQMQINDVLVMLGKGNEEYEKVLGYRFLQSDEKMIKEALDS